MAILQPTHCPVCGRELGHRVLMPAGEKPTGVPLHKDDRSPICQAPPEPKK